MEKYRLINMLIGGSLYENNTDWKKSLETENVTVTKDIELLFTELIKLGAPKRTNMVEIVSDSPMYGEETRVYLPCTKIQRNTQWFAVANLLCELICNEKIWRKKQFVVEKTGVDPTGMQRTERFYERFDNMLQQWGDKYPGDKPMLDEFRDKVECLGNPLSRYMISAETDAQAVGAVVFIDMDTEDKMEFVKERAAHLDWKTLARQEEFCCIDRVAESFERAQTSKGKFRMTLSWVYFV